MVQQSLLLKVADSVKKYAEVLASILNMDVDIADRNLIRLAGTGRFAAHVDMHMENEGNAFKWVLKNKKPLVVDIPRAHEVCLSCAAKDTCMEKFEICCPIILNNEVIGVIALVTFDEKIGTFISMNFPKYMDFLENIADLIAAKAAEYKSYEEQVFSLELLKKLMNFINEGVIVFREDDTILFMNKKAELLLGNNLLQLKYLHKINKFSIQKVKSTNKSSDVEYICNVQGKRIRLIGNIHPILVDEKEVSDVFIFQDIISLHQKLLEIQTLDCYNFDDLIGKDEYFLQVKERAKMLSYTERNILICGETGTGKEVFARAIHNESTRKNKPFVTVMCSGAVDTILEKEIFGENPYFATDDGVSKIALSKEGTLFIDEIGDMSLRLQGRLIEAIGMQKDKDVRVIAASTKDLKVMVETGQFRKDLYYSLETFSITIPPVRSRPEDIELLIDYFLEKYSYLEAKVIVLDREARELLHKYTWPGNVREIENVVGFIVNVHTDDRVIGVEGLPVVLQNSFIDSDTGQYNLEKIEKETILKALNVFGNSTQAKKHIARELGISTATLYRKLIKYSIVEDTQFYINSHNEN